MQAAAEQAVKGKPKASVVAVKPSTGEILRRRQLPADGFNNALRGLLRPRLHHEGHHRARCCSTRASPRPASRTRAPSTSSTAAGSSRTTTSSRSRTARSRRASPAPATPPSSARRQSSKDGDLTKEARDVFGIGLNWQVGTRTFDGSVPVQSRRADGRLADRPGRRADEPAQHGVRLGDRAERHLQAAVSVAPSLDDRTLAKAPRAMKPQAASDLQEPDAADRHQRHGRRGRWPGSAATSAPRPVRPRSTARRSRTPGSRRTAATSRRRRRPRLRPRRRQRGPGGPQDPGRRRGLSPAR